MDILCQWSSYNGRIFLYDTDSTKRPKTVQFPENSKYVGRVELLGERGDLVQILLNGGNVQYKVHFPLLHPVPKITAIIFNGNVICSGPPAIGQYVTSINLEHVLYTSGDVPTGSRPGYYQNQNYNQYRPNLNQQFTPETVYQENNNYYDQTTRPYRPNFNNNRPNRPNSAPSVVYNENTQPQPENVEYNRPVYTVVKDDYDDNYDPIPNPDNFARPKTTTTRKPPAYVPEKPQTSTENFRCGIPHSSAVPLIIAGDGTEKGEWPWLVAIFMKKVNGLSYICSGSLVSDRHVVSAGHCIQQKSNRPPMTYELVPRIGAYNIHDWTDTTTINAVVEKIYLHPDFDYQLGLKADISILRIQKVHFSNFIIPVCIWAGNDDLNRVVGKRGTVVGWGKDENGLIATPEPRSIEVPIVSTDTCKSSRMEFFKLTRNTTLCAGDKDGSGPCNGDSGGGLYLYQNKRWMLRGIVSNSLNESGRKTCNLHEYVVYTDAAKFAPWIREVMRDTS